MDLREQIDRLIEDKQWNFKDSNNEYIIQRCPLCSDGRWHLYINKETGLWMCHKCSARGNFYQLVREVGSSVVKPLADILGSKKELPDQSLALKYHQTLLKTPRAMNYLAGRGFNEETIGHFKLGCVRLNNIDWLTIPHYAGGILYNIKFRTLPPAEKSFKRIENCPSILFNQDCLKEFDEIILCEGEMDAMTLWQEGYKNVVATTIGAGGFDPAWFELLKPAKKIYIAYDNDVNLVGQRQAEKLAKRLGSNRCYQISLPCKDVNEYFLNKYTKEDFDKIISSSNLFPIPNVSSFTSIIEKLEYRKLTGQKNWDIETPWPNVNRIIGGGFLFGDMIVLSAPPGTGKTSWSLNIALHIARKGFPVFYYCLELPIERLAPMFICAEMNKDLHSLDLDVLKEAKERFSKLPIYLGYSSKNIDRDSVLDTIQETINRYDIKFVVLDNINYLARDLHNVTQELGIITKTLRTMAITSEVLFLVIAQPRKRKEADKMDKMMHIEDIRDSDAPRADADWVFLLHRRPLRQDPKKVDLNDLVDLTSSLDPITVVRADKARFSGGGETRLYFDGSKSVFRLIEKSIPKGIEGIEENKEE